MRSKTVAFGAGAVLGALLAIAACSSKAPAGESPTMGGDASTPTSPPSSTATPPGETGGGSDAGGGSGNAGAAADAGVPPAVPGLGSATFDGGDLDPPSHGGTLTFTQIGAPGWYPSRRDPATGPCDASDGGTCCLAKDEVTSDQLTPWDQDLVMTLRGPIQVKQLAVYQPAGSAGDTWQLVSGWDDRNPTNAEGISFDGDATPKTSFAGGVGSECSVNVATSQVYACGAGSLPYCPTSSKPQYYGWAGSKLFVILARMPHAGTPEANAACSTTTTGNWYDASWLGLGLGELARAGAYASCQCFAKDPSKWYLADGCGQFNVFEVVNDNNSYKNLDVFSTDLIDYSGYVGQGPCGSKCDVTKLAPAVDLIDKTTDTEAAQGATATPAGGPSAALRRPSSGYRYFLVALDVGTRTVQLALVHPQNVPSALGTLLPSLPGAIPRATVDAVLGLRLPK
ncbi:MAG TPA: DUF2403 domain-containing protein [Polyangiaceae bacterium]|jgi:hypothetical protein